MVDFVTDTSLFICRKARRSSNCLWCSSGPAVVAVGSTVVIVLCMLVLAPFIYQLKQDVDKLKSSKSDTFITNSRSLLQCTGYSCKERCLFYSTLVSVAACNRKSTVCDMGMLDNRREGWLPSIGVNWAVLPVKLIWKWDVSFTIHLILLNMGGWNLNKFLLL